MFGHSPGNVYTLTSLIKVADDQQHKVKWDEQMLIIARWYNKKIDRPTQLIYNQNLYGFLFDNSQCERW